MHLVLKNMGEGVLLKRADLELYSPAKKRGWLLIRKNCLNAGVHTTRKY